MKITATMKRWAFICTLVISFLGNPYAHASGPDLRKLELYVHAFEDTLAVAQWVTGHMPKAVPAKELNGKETKTILDPKTGNATQILISEALDKKKANAALIQALKPHMYQPWLAYRPTNEEEEKDIALPLAQLLQLDDGAPFSGRVVGWDTLYGGPEPIYTKELAPLARALTGNAPKIIAGKLPDGDLADVICDPETGLPKQILLSDALPPENAQPMFALAVAYAINLLAGGEMRPGATMRPGIPIAGLEPELRKVYNLAKTGEDRTENLHGPEDDGLTGDDIPRALMAEAIRVYMTNMFSYMAIVAPNTKERIRTHVNGNPRLREIIQFN